MTVLDQQRLTQATLALDIDGIRRGVYSDRYFANVVGVLDAAAASGYRYSGAYPMLHGVELAAEPIGDLVVEAQVFTRRAPYALVAGIDAALAMLRHAAGGFDADGRFRETWDTLEVRAVYDGVFVHYDGHPEDVLPVLKIRGRYRDFALLETTLLGVLSRASRIATAVYEVLRVSAGKPTLFFPARFDMPDVQAIDGYAYWLAVQVHNARAGTRVVPGVSTDAQGAWWGGRGGGTVPHALIAAFMGDTAEAMRQFALFAPLTTPRIVLADFNNDVVTDSLRTLDVFWAEYRAARLRDDRDAMLRWTLHGVRLDTGATMRDRAMEPDGPLGVNPVLVRHLRAVLDAAWERWSFADEAEREAAIAYCKAVRIAVTGGFNRDRIAQFEAEAVPVDIYGVGSSLLRNDPAANTDFTMDVVRVRVNGAWHEVAKVGRRANDNPDLVPVDLGRL
jgi:nicotinate phosphoribosyltransferase